MKVNSPLIVSLSEFSYTSDMTERKRTITPEDKRAAAELKRIWEKKKGPLKLTQQRAADMWGSKATQGLIGQYLNGHTALGRVACMKFARILQVRPEQIRADFEYSPALPDDIPADVVRMAYKLSCLPENVRKDLNKTIDVYMAASNYSKFLSDIETKDKAPV